MSDTFHQSILGIEGALEITKHTFNFFLLSLLDKKTEDERRQVMQSRCHSRLEVEPAYLRAQKRHGSEAGVADLRGEERAGSRKASQGGSLLVLGEGDMATAILSWGCPIRVQTSYCLNCRELLMKLSVGLSGRGVVSVITGSNLPLRQSRCLVDMGHNIEPDL